MTIVMVVVVIEMFVVQVMLVMMTTMSKTTVKIAVMIRSELFPIFHFYCALNQF